MADYDSLNKSERLPASGRKCAIINDKPRNTYPYITSILKMRPKVDNSGLLSQTHNPCIQSSIQQFLYFWKKMFSVKARLFLPGCAVLSLVKSRLSRFQRRNMAASTSSAGRDKQSGNSTLNDDLEAKSKEFCPGFKDVDLFVKVWPTVLIAHAVLTPKPSLWETTWMAIAS